MATIRFKLENSEVWHELKLPYKLSKNNVRDAHELSNIIKHEQDVCTSSRAKMVEVVDDNNQIASSSNILDSFMIDYKEKEF